MSAVSAVSGEGPLAMLCGGGSLPLAVAEKVTKSGRSVLLFPLRGAAEGTAVERFPHHWVHIGQIGKFMRLARAAGCRDVVFIGSLVRPSLWQVHPDLKGLSVLPRVIAAYRGGDNHLLTGMGKVLEQDGFRLLGAHEVAPDILIPEGTFGRVQASERDHADIALGLDYLRTAGRFDIGQAVVVAGLHVLAVEAAEGTDAMLARVAEMRTNGRVRAPRGTGVLVKAPKPAQDRRFDLPSIGPMTVEGVVRAGLAGIAVVAGSTIVAEAEQLVSGRRSRQYFCRRRAVRTGQMSPHIFLVAGEESGDRLGAALIAAIKQRTKGHVHFSCVGGAHMAAEGVPSLFPLGDLAIIGFAAIPKSLPKILRRIRETADAVVSAKPDALVIIDSPEFTHRVAKRVRAQTAGNPDCRLRLSVGVGVASGPRASNAGLRRSCTCAATFRAESYGRTWRSALHLCWASIGRTS